MDSIIQAGVMINGHIFCLGLSRLSYTEDRQNSLINDNEAHYVEVSNFVFHAQTHYVKVSNLVFYVQAHYVEVSK